MIKMRYSYLILLFIVGGLFAGRRHYDYDVVFTGPVSYCDGLGRLCISFLDMLNQDFKCGFSLNKNKPQINFNGLDDFQKTFFSTCVSNGKVMLSTHLLGVSEEGDSNISSFIKIAYSMFETTVIPEKWVEDINKNFDCVIVPDNFLIEVYKKSGVKKPVFELPIPLELEHFFAQSIQKTTQDVFIFGSSMGLYCGNKNWELLVNTFIKTFGNDPKYRLKIHGRLASEEYWQRLLKKTACLECTNIELIHQNLSKEEFLDFMTSLDCYVLLSKGEGFSITPREALALGIPCILANNTAQKTICDTGFVYSVPSLIFELAYKPMFGNLYIGHNFNCHIEDSIKAFHAMVNNYAYYKEKARDGKKWVEQYTKPSLRARYKNLIKPSKIVLGNRNSIEEECLTTTSYELYCKYKKLAFL